MKSYILFALGKELDIKDSMFTEVLMFLTKQFFSAIFGILLIIGFILTVHSDFRYDILFIYAIGLQYILYKSKFETKRDVLVITIFHLVGLTMELIEVSINNAWVYDSTGLFYIFSVPIFTGFMYASVGSYISKASELFKLKISNLPSNLVLVIIGVLIYTNFIINNNFFDFRWIIYGLLIITTFKASFEFTIITKTRRMNFLVAFFLIGILIWGAENIATLLGIWSYPDQVDGWSMVSISKVSSWMLLSIVSFIIIHIIGEKK